MSVSSTTNKLCKKCGELKPATTEFFYSHKTRKYGLATYCKPCSQQSKRESVAKYRDEYRGKAQLYSSLPHVKCRRNAQKRLWRMRKRADPVYVESERKKARAYWIVRMSRIQSKLRSTISTRLRMAIKQNSKSGSTLTLLGCTIAYLKKHIESLWADGMTWENYGNPNGDHTNCWHIDHIKPCTSFDLRYADQQAMCFNYTNLQPMWGKENILKSNKWQQSDHTNHKPTPA